MERLPRGRHSLSSEYVARHQRERLIAALTEALFEQGYDKTTLSVVSKRAAVSKSDFYKHFWSKDACFLVAYDDAVRRLRKRVVASCAGRADWAQGVCAGLAASIAFLANEPARARLVLVEGLRGGLEAYDRFQQAVQGFVHLLRDDAPEMAAGGRQPAAIDEAVVGGVASLLARRVLVYETDGLEALLPELAEFALTPYLGAVEARRIVS
jgi:AcrR family transcriptional regulator